MPDLVPIFDALQVPLGTGPVQYSAQPIPGVRRHRVAKDKSGFPALLLSVTSSTPSPVPNPVILKHLVVQHDVQCRISFRDGHSTEETFTVVRCAGSDRVLHVYFLNVMASILTLLGDSPSRSDVTAAVNRLVELFQALTEEPRKSLQGLWAELFLVANGSDPTTLIQAWHVNPADRYDFALGDQRIEVKSASRRLRQHHFSLEQLSPPPGSRVVVASVFTEPMGGGVSVMDLLTQIHRRIAGNANAALAVDRIVGATLGNGLERGNEEKFDFELAESSLQFFDVRSIPRIDLVDVPPGVSEVRFKADLSNVAPVNEAALHAMGTLFQASCPHVATRGTP
ncbi:MAG: PD-(D/E)XK motif protein [Betaproteobacteria bacterium]